MADCNERLDGQGRGVPDSISVSPALFKAFGQGKDKEKEMCVLTRYL